MSDGTSVSGPRRWIVRGAILGSVLLSCVAVVGVVLDRLEAMSAPVPSVLGLRLGASVDSVRAVRGGSDWTTRVDQSGDLEVSRDDESYWFHEGLLVAVDLRLPASAPDATGPERAVTAGSVLAREPLGSRVRVRLISRTCPTHAAAAEALLRDAPR